jgi:hypothetical protein
VSRLESFAPPAGLQRVRARALLIGGVASALSLVGLWQDPGRFVGAYLVSFLFWVAIPLGALALLMLHHVTGGGWGMMIRRILEAATRTLPLMVVLFVPLALGLRRVYPWADPAKVAQDALLAHRAPWLNGPFFLVRAALYFALWGGLALLLNRLSRRQDGGDGAYFARRMQRVSGPGILLFCLLATLASVDWLMSLNDRWFSSIYGIYFIGAQALTAIAFAIVVARLLAEHGPLRDVLRPQHFHDYGNLMLAFLMLWGYFNLSQFIIIWSGNIPEEITWYMERTHGVYQAVARILILFNFAVPFLLLLPHAVKRDARRLSMVAALVLVMRWVDLFWHAAPALGVHTLHWLDFVVPAAMGGLWVAAFVHELRKRPLLPVNDPNLRLQEAAAHG